MSLEKEVEELARRVEELEGRSEFKRHDHVRIEYLTRDVGELREAIDRIEDRLRRAAAQINIPEDNEDAG